MSSTRSKEKIKDEGQERIEKYCNRQALPYSLAKMATAFTAGALLGADSTLGAYIFGTSALFFHGQASATFEKCVKEESVNKAIKKSAAELKM
jgi:hypothetical protein